MTAHEYLLTNQQHDAGARFSALAALYDSVTRKHLAALGIQPGWRCWEVGAGGPSLLVWLSEQVGAGGRVLATDIDTSWLEDTADPVIEVRRHDVAQDHPPGERFDLIHARLVLVHVPDRDHALRKIVASLRPGARYCSRTTT